MYKTNHWNKILKNTIITDLYKLYKTYVILVRSIFVLSNQNECIMIFYIYFKHDMSVDYVERCPIYMYLATPFLLHMSVRVNGLNPECSVVDVCWWPQRCFLFLYRFDHWFELLSTSHLGPFIVCRSIWAIMSDSVLKFVVFCPIIVNFLYIVI